MIKNQSFDVVLKKARLAIYAKGIAYGLLKLGALVFGLVGFFIMMDDLLQLPAAIRLPLSILSCFAIGMGAYKWLWKNLIHWPDLLRTARMLEQATGVEREAYSNAFQLDQLAYDGVTGQLAGVAIERGFGSLRSVSTGKIFNLKQMRGWIVGFAVLILPVVFYTCFAPDIIPNALYRFALPLADVAPKGDVSLVLLPKSDVTVFKDDDIEILVVVKPNGKAPSQSMMDAAPMLVTMSGEDRVPADWSLKGEQLRPLNQKTILERFSQRTGHPAEPQYLLAHGTDIEKSCIEDGWRMFSILRNKVQRPFGYRVFHREGKTYSTSRAVRLFSLPEIAGSRVTITPPGYAGNETIQSMGPPQPISCLPGSNISVHMRLNRPVPRLIWASGKTQIPFQLKGDEYVVEAVVDGTTNYRILVQDEGFNRPAVLAAGSVLLKEDRTPEIFFDLDSQSLSVMPGEKIEIPLRIQDDLGVKEVTLTYRNAQDERAEAKVIQTWAGGKAPGIHTFPAHLTASLDVDTKDFILGEDYILEATCRDYNPAGQEGRASPLLISVVNVLEKKLDDQGQVQVGDLYEALDAAIKSQTDALKKTEQVGKYTDDLVGFPEPGQPVRYDLHTYVTAIVELQKQVLSYVEQGIKINPSDKAAVVEQLVQLRDGKISESLKKAKSGNSAEWWGPSSAKTTEVQAKGKFEDNFSFPPQKGRYLRIVWNQGGRKQLTMTPKFADPVDSLEPKVLMGGAAISKADGVIVIKKTSPRGSDEGAVDMLFDFGKPVTLIGLHAKDGYGIAKHCEIGMFDENQVRTRLPAVIEELRKTQTAALNGLFALRAKEAGNQQAMKAASIAEENKLLGIAVSTEEVLEKKLEELKGMVTEIEDGHEDVSKKAKSILDKPALDLTDGEQAELAGLTQESRALGLKGWMMVQDLSSLGQMDFSDPFLAQSVREIEERARSVAEALDAEANALDPEQNGKDGEKEDRKKMWERVFDLDNGTKERLEDLMAEYKEATVGGGGPMSKSSGTETKEQLEDEMNQATLMELPQELRDVVAALEYEQKALTQEEKATASTGTELSDQQLNPDGAAPFQGTESSTAADGITSGQEPNSDTESEGRSGFGRTGMANGQGAESEAAAIPDNKRMTAERDTGGTLQQGNVKDHDKEAQANATGLGNQTDATSEFGLSGTKPPTASLNMKDTYEKQKNIRESAENLVLVLENYNMPSDDLTKAIEKMRVVEKAIQEGSAGDLDQLLIDAKEAMASAQSRLDPAIVQHQQSGGFEKNQIQVNDAASRAMSPTHRKMLGEYFKSIAEDTNE
ncbi:MAG: hypothetical protein V4727_03380 [Verrucomicrobiota bacterium]